MSKYSNFNDWLEAEAQKKADSQYNNMQAIKRAREKQVKETILNSVKNCNDAGFVVEKKLLFDEFERRGFPVEREFIEKILKELIDEKTIIDVDDMLWLKGAGKLKLNDTA